MISLGKLHAKIVGLIIITVLSIYPEKDFVLVYPSCCRIRGKR